jgi:hypothetical protein
MRRLKRIALVLLLAAIAAFLLIWLLPPPPARTAQGRSILDIAMPAYQFSEEHSVEVCADPPVIRKAIEEVTAAEFPGLSLFTWLPRLQRLRRAAAERPVFPNMERAGFVRLSPPRSEEVVYGIAGAFWQPRNHQRKNLRSMEHDPVAFASASFPDSAKAAINFRLEGQIGRCPLLITETRIICPGPDESRAFARYWRIIYPGSSYLRRCWLSAIRDRSTKR